MSKISCSICGRIHERNYICNAKRKRQIERNNNKNSRLDSKIYNTKRWKKLRYDILQEYDSIDLFSYYVFGKITIADNVHHITELQDNPDMAYDWDNLIPLGEHTHRKIVHKLYNINIELKKELQTMLLDMINSYSKGNKELKCYTERFNSLLNKYNCNSMFSV